LRQRHVRRARHVVQADWRHLRGEQRVLRQSLRQRRRRGEPLHWPQCMQGSGYVMQRSERLLLSLL
jgi:hypothetical protein